MCAPDVVAAITELRVAATGDNLKTTADVPWAVRPSLCRALRYVAREMRLAAGEVPSPVADQLDGIADGLEDAYTRRMAHQI